VIGFVGGIPDAPANHILLKNYAVVGVHWGASLGRDPSALDRQMAAIFELAGTGAVDPLLHRVYAMAEGARALQDMYERRVTGKVIVAPG
jgi:NADPH2:quinone reductase